MTAERPPLPPERAGPREAWRIERLVHRAPPHLGETGSRRWIVWPAIAVGVIVLAVGAFLLFGMGKPPAESSSSNAPIAAPQSSPTLQAPSAATRPLLTETPPAPATSARTALPPTPAPPPPSSTVKYRVKIGDTLTSIAARFHVTIRALMEANDLRDDTILAGDELLIPLPTRTPK